LADSTSDITARFRRYMEYEIRLICVKNLTSIFGPLRILANLGNNRKQKKLSRKRRNTFVKNRSGGKFI
jgi:hypothetical protein